MSFKKGKSKALVSSEIARNVQELIDHGKTYPSLKALVRSSVPLCPQALRVVLSYGFNVAVSTAAGELDSYQFTGNGLFDPDVTGVGNQPMGFDQWHAFYSRNRVLASTIEFDTTTPDATTTEGVQLDVAVFPSISTSLPTSMRATRAIPYVKAKTVSGHYPGARHFKSSMETALLMGHPKMSTLIDDNLAGSGAANPANLWYWNIQSQPTDEAAATLIHFTGTIHYLVDFWDRNLITISENSSRALKKRGSLSSISKK